MKIRIKQKQTEYGFTLIELLVILAIVAFLATGVLAAVTQARAGSRDAQRLQEIQTLQKSLDLYYGENGRYPLSTGCGATTPNANWCNSIETLSGNGFWIKDSGTDDVLSGQINKEPTDPIPGTVVNWTPLNGGTYFYFSDSGGAWYMLVFGLENYPAGIESIDGVTDCGSTLHHFGDGTNGIITAGTSCEI